MTQRVIQTGESVPEIALPRDGGNVISLQGLRPSPVVLFFYPRDLTSGCTKEAIAFSQLRAEFDALGAKVFGISKDTVASHDKFVAKHDLTVPLLSDAEGDIAEQFGVWQEKKMYGKTFFGIVRSTFLIDGAGVLVREWRKVKVDGHAEDVLDAVRAL
ncbi:peroxiredoxin [Marinovum sp. 2_MG-2023]|uniref:peroxiredoxin n=1 Tax=Roseobacteraceae TaxID=2854170 RepID=UPI001FD44ACE|nr:MULTISPECIES: peroxiredoxin [Roseobacteraceae]MCJ7873632.1 peroxiredoxin [Phaeobacter sp. J2-8]MDO6730418.1 peroxiredoxin [Marinovum sp. 2_MG-2023]MDO6778398.1 peroxiredoxin [Marinovum sp. 1_MG-2023]